MTDTTTVKHPQISPRTRFRWSAIYLALRIAFAAAFFIAATAAARRIGFWFTLPIAACASALICGSVAIKLNWTAGRAPRINQLSLIVLPLGGRTAATRLPRIFASSAALWFTIAIAGAIYGHLQSHEINPASPHAPALRLILTAGLIADSTTFVLLTLQAVTHLTPKSPTLLPMTLSLTALLALTLAGPALWTTNHPWAALFLSAGPPLIAAAIYGVLFIMLFSSHKQ